MFLQNVSNKLHIIQMIHLKLMRILELKYSMKMKSVPDLFKICIGFDKEK